MAVDSEDSLNAKSDSHRVLTIDVYVGRLRRKVDVEGLPPIIHTVRGVGYTLREGDS